MSDNDATPELKQPEHDVDGDEDVAVNLEVILTVFFPVIVIAILGDAVVDVRVANLVEERIDEKRASDDARPQMPSYNRAVRRNVRAPLDDASDQAEERD